MTARDLVRLQLPAIVLAVVPILLALRFGGYHARHAGWVVLGLAAWACVQAARGRLSAPRSAAGVASIAIVVLALWTAASISWAVATRHDAWVEAMRALGYASMFLLGGSLLANGRTYARLATLVGAGIAGLALVVAFRVTLSDSPLTSFVAGRLDWPVGYAPGMAGFCLFGMLLLLGVATASEQRFARTHEMGAIALGALALGGATACAAVALLAQSRGTLPAILVGVVVSLLATPRRATWLLRLVLIGLALVASRAVFAAPFQTQFSLRQAPFTDGADATALATAAEAAAHDAAVRVIVLAVVLAIVGAVLVPIGVRCSAWLAEFERSRGHGLALPITVGAAALVATLLVITSGSSSSPTAWAADQYRGCVDPPERVNDPGSGASYFANSGTGRCDYYRVALIAFRDHPVRGLGAGNFRSAYVAERRTAEDPRVVHSLPLQLLAELGIVGALLGAAVLGSVCLAAWRFIGSGTARDGAFAGAIGALAYWTTHASIDWLWQLPAVSLPALALAGGLVACVSPAQRQVSTAVAAPFAAAAMLGAIALVLPVTMADARLREARDPDTPRAAAATAARDAQEFDPTWAEPAIVEGTIQAAAGNRKSAADAARRAVRLEPRSWSVQYRASGLIGLDSTQEGFRAFEAARRLNPQLPAGTDPKADDAEASADPDALQNSDG
ncbi:MAG: O-antigen polymerase [Thermoleophilia bacterium]|nr:O-antigen polymerase [Thermoleophilia bacterium]